MVRNILRNEGFQVKQANDDERLCKKGKNEEFYARRRK